MLLMASAAAQQPRMNDFMRNYPLKKVKKMLSRKPRHSRQGSASGLDPAQFAPAIR
jgi:hypothetical protein